MPVPTPASVRSLVAARIATNPSCRPAPATQGALPLPWRRLALRVVGAACLLLPAAGCYQDPEQVLQQQQLINDMTDAVNEIGLRMADLQAAVDSLSGVVARQDTVIYRMANVTGVAYQMR